MHVTLNTEQLDSIQKHAKLYNYLLSTLTKSYFVLGDNKFSIMFKGSKGALKTTIDVQCASPVKHFQCDYTKFNNALSKVGFASSVTMTLTDKQLRIAFDGADNTVVSLAVTTYAKQSPEAQVIDNYIDEMWQEYIEGAERLDITDDANNAIAVAASMFTAVGKNNAIAVTDQYALYSDRSVVLKAHFGERVAVTGTVLLHKYLLGAIALARRDNTMFYFSSTYDMMAWADNAGTSFVLASEPCEIAIPSDEDIAGIVPSQGGRIVVDHKELLTGLAFFSGFYDSVAWKPITIRVSGKKEMSLYYRHPSTEIAKEVKAIESSQAEEGEFIVMSEVLQKLVARSVELNAEDSPVVLQYDANSAGVLCNIGALYTVVLAKLLEG